MIEGKAREIRQSRIALAICGSAFALGASAPVTRADFPFLPRSGGDARNPATFKLAPGETPTNFNDDWKLAATPEIPSLSNPAAAALTFANNAKPTELCGIRGDSLVDSRTTIPAGTGSCIPAGTRVDTAFEQTTGRPDVGIAVLDSGIDWSAAGAMTALRKKVRLNPGELPAPRVDRASSLDPAVDCNAVRATGPPPTGADYAADGATRRADGSIPYDVLRQGAFNVLDYACDARVSRSDPRRHGPANVLTPEDVILAFNDGVDHDHNGYVNDIAGWNYVDNNNDPYDDVHYGHGTGEATDSSAEANTSQELGTCPNCMVLPLRVGESFIADVNRFAQAVLYATDRGIDVVQEALGTLNNSRFARQAIDYAYSHGTTVVASAADEAAEHHNQPGALPHTIVVNSVVKYASIAGVPFTPASPSYLQFNGCTNFSTKVAVAVPSSSCSSEAAGKSAGVAGLIYSAARNAQDAGTLAAAGDCTRVDGTACPVTPNEVRQLMASGHVGGTSPADAGNGGQADQVSFTNQPEPSCTSAPLVTCTDPNSNFGSFSLEQNGGIDVSPLATTRRYPARHGFNEFYGYGRLNAQRAVAAAAAARIPPEVDITTPDWFQRIDPAQRTLTVAGHVSARAAYTCRVYVAPGGQPNNGATSDSSPGDFKQISSAFCDGSTLHTGAYDGTLAAVDLADLKSRFPSGLDFGGNENGLAGAQSANGRPNTMPYAFTVRVVAESTSSGVPMSGEDRRQMFLQRDKDMLSGFPKELGSDGASSPLLTSLSADNRNELVLATSDGLVHAFKPDGSELPGWPVHTDSLPLHSGDHAYATVGTDHYGAVLGGLAAGDLFRDGRTEIVADDNQGKVYAWDASGQLVFRAEANPAFSGAPLSPFATVRQNARDRTEHGFFSAPVLADLSGKGGPLDIIAAGEDRHLYAWHPDGSAVAGFPVEIYDHDKASIDNATTGHLAFNANAAANPGASEDQGKLVDTPAVAFLDGPGKAPSIVIGSNEEYAVNTGNEGSINAGAVTAASLGVIGQVGLLGFANSRLYVVKADGNTSGNPYRAGWPKKIGIINRGLLPDVGEGITGSPAVGPITCTSGGAGAKIAAIPDAGPGYVFNADGSSCYGSTGGADNPLELDFSVGAGQYDHPAFPAVGNPALGTLDGSTLDVFAPVTGLQRALDVVAPDYQGGQDFIGAWNATSGQYRLGFPSPVNDLQFLTGQVVGDILGQGAQQQVIGGTASLDLQALNSLGLPASSSWPKLTGDWTVATPLLGSFGTLDTDPAARKDVISITRSGTLSVYRSPATACSPSSWPRYHHDNANSGDYSRDAVQPGAPYDLSLSGGTLSFTAPGGDLLCGRATRYEVVQSDQQILPQTFASGQAISGVPSPAPAGTRQSLTLPVTPLGYVAIRAIDQAGNIGPPAVITTNTGAGGGAPGGGGKGTGSGPGSGPGNAGSSQPGGAGAHCTPHAAPSSRIGARARITRRGVRLRGRSRAAAGCFSRVVRVAVAVARVVGKRCRFLRADGHLSRRASCRRPIFLPARGTTRWRFSFAARLPPGRYRLLSRAVNAAGIVERARYRRHAVRRR
ncbi:MAG: hypothetical protein ACR2ND_03410 [Solirubrobacteraceae bacterium]